jgi:hypothetical protein
MAAPTIPARGGARSRTALLLALPAALILLGALMRTPVLLTYRGPLTAHALNVDLMAHVGGYSDISHLFLRDHLGRHPMPYFDFRFEYPVLTGLFVWVASFVHTSVAAYFLSSTGLLLCLGLAAVWAISRIDGASPWLFAAAPALALYGTLNWDLLGICLLVVSLLLFQRGRDGLGAAALALGTSAKLFPIVVLPIIVALRLAERRRGSASLIAAVFTGTTLAVNLPFALTGAGSIRANWSYFFTYTDQRPPRGTIWHPLLGHAADLVSVPLFAAGLAVIVILAVGARSRPGGALIPASSAALLWVFATAKVYSPQYSLWIFAVLALEGAPVALAVAFAALDVLIFASTFGPLHPAGPIASDFPLVIQWGAYGLRQLVTAWLAIWVIRGKLKPGAAGLVLPRLGSTSPAR